MKFILVKTYGHRRGFRPRATFMHFCARFILVTMLLNMFSSYGFARSLDPNLDMSVELPGADNANSTYEINVLGEVKNPGTYRASNSTRLSEALGMAGGVSEQGSERNIELRRDGSKTKIIDLFSFKVLGQLDKNPYLKEKDVIFVPLKKYVVQIEGAIKRPGAYELRQEDSLDNLITLAGSYTPGVMRAQPVKVIRYQDGQKQVLDVALEKNELAHFILKNGDVVVIPHLLTRDKKLDYNLSNLPGNETPVTVSGAVFNPGAFPYNPYYNVQEYVNQAGGFSRMAKKRKIQITNAAGKTDKTSLAASVNPGDTIVVPERYLRPETWITMILGVSATVLGATGTIIGLTR